ncbi:MAG: type II toxin-antitoxin system PemK/MazF family toxin [Clostridiales bacterium]|nr:type II toxin-antitoxin system PemK/MazF family toxin [Clostridiales bacterium]
MGRKNKRKHEKIKPVRAGKYVGGNYANNGRAYTDGGRYMEQSRTYHPVGVHSADSQQLVSQPEQRQEYKPRPRRGDIWFAKLGNHYGTSVQSGTRPVLVISNDTANHFSYTFTVLPMTSKMKHPEMPTHIRLGENDCVQCGETALQESMVLAEQIVPLDRSALLEKIAYIDDKEKMAEIEQAVGIQLGIHVCTATG